MRNPYTKRKEEWYTKGLKKTGASSLRGEEGYMTVFGCLLFLAVMSLLFLCLDGCLLYQAETRCSMAQNGLSEHLLANYSQPLAQRYHLYFLDPKMGEQEMQKRSLLYYKELFAEGEKKNQARSRLLQLETECVEAIPFGTMEERECQYLIAQIKDCIKYDLTKDLIFAKLKSAAQETEPQSGQIDETIEDLSKNQSAAEEDLDAAESTLKSSEINIEESADKLADQASPIQKIRSILKDGILGVVVDESTLSERKLTPSLLPFPDQKENKIHISMELFENLDQIKQLLSQENLGEWTESVTDKGAISFYMRKYFNYYGREKQLEDTNLLYETEYLLGGQDSDKENLEYVVNRLILLRFALNSTYGFADEELRKEALAAAVLLAGVTGSPELTEVVRYLILSAVNLIESITDVKDLMEGKKVPLVKTAATWKTSISGQAKEHKGKDGLPYEDYLLLLLVTKTNTEQMCLRMQNLVQLNLQKEDPTFQIRQCHAGVWLSSKIRYQGRFSLGEYLLEDKEKFQY